MIYSNPIICSRGVQRNKLFILSLKQGHILDGFTYHEEIRQDRITGWIKLSLTGNVYLQTLFPDCFLLKQFVSMCDKTCF